MRRKKLLEAQYSLSVVSSVVFKVYITLIVFKMRIAIIPDIYIVMSLPMLVAVTDRCSGTVLCSLRVSVNIDEQSINIARPTITIGAIIQAQLVKA